MDTISSTENPHVKLARSLHEAKGRERHRAFLVEGLRLVEAAAQVEPPRVVLHTPDFAASDGRAGALLQRLADARATLRSVSPRVLAHVSDTVHPQGIVAVMPIPETSRGPHPPTTLDLVLDGVSDPGNAGTLLRTAAATGAGRVVCGPGTVDVYGPKVVRAAAGAHFAIGIEQAHDWDEVSRALGRGTQVILADVNAPRRHWGVDWTLPSALIVSSEARGASEAARRLATSAVAIPMASGVESLNAGVAGSIILYEALRQRMAVGENA